MQAARRSLGPSLTLQHFVLQSSFIHAYRSAIRSTRPIPDEKTRRETVDWLRSDIERLRMVTDINVLNSSLSEFNRQIKMLSPQLGLTGADPSTGAKLVGRGGRRAVKW